MNFPTSTVNVLPYLQDLKKKWRDQDFRFTKEQQEEYDMLMQARRERVAWFYETNRVQVGPKVTKKEEVQEEED
jgi:hypothetical protein|tara:strand:- start:117 stop:338 length:222 start_codon:yes stop_codon:yes gene_type:complete